ncbi:MAG: smc 3 [Gemmataceae bacterium]|nr:smc 3 [Gemmataceae bacterium]
MMAPLPSPTPSPDRPELPRVRLEVRTGAGRAVSYEVGTDEFLIGGAAGCDLRLPGAGLPPVICQITRKADGVRVRRVAPALSVQLNGAPISGNTSTAVSDGDRLGIAGVEVTVGIQHTSYVSPKLIPLDPHAAAPQVPPVPSPAGPSPLLQEEVRRLEERKRELADEEAARGQEWARRDADLVRRQRDLDTQTEDLEADRVLWYRRRQEMEHELARVAPGPRAADLDAREQEVNRVRSELAALREELIRQYHERRDQLAQTQELVRAASGRLQEERTAFETEQEERRAALETELEKHRKGLEVEAAERRALLEAEVQRKREAFEAELAGRAAQVEAETLDRYRAKMEDLDRAHEALRETAARHAERREQLEVEITARRDRAEAEAAGRIRQADEEIARHRAALDAEIAAHEPRLADLRDGQARLAAGLQDLARQREAVAADRDLFTRARETFEAERAAETERLGTWEKTLSDRQTDLTRREAVLGADRESYEHDRAQLNEDLLRLDRRRAEAEDRDRALGARTREADIRLEQLKRDAAEWEETVRLAAAEQERLRAEADRLDRQRADLDTQTAKLAERAAQLEAQQGVLAVLRAKLDRTREEAEREATALAAARVREDEAQNELRDRIREAEQLRATLNTVQENATQELRRLEERDSLLAAGLEEIRQQKETLAAEEIRLRQRESDLDTRSAEFAEQAGALKGRMSQALDLQARLEADRVAVREREAALAQAEEARQALQDQLHRRAEDLLARSKALDEHARQLAADRGLLEQIRATTEGARIATEERLAVRYQEMETRTAEVDRQAQLTAEREAALGRQVVRLKEVGQAVAAERKSLADARAKWDADRTAAEEAARKAREELDAFRVRAAAEVEALRAQAPELEEQSKAALDRLTAAKDVLRGHLGELNGFARQSREDLEAIRAQVRAEADRLRGQEAALDRARAEHRLAVTGFRQQLVEWQGTVAEMKQGLARGESRLEARQAAVDEAARQVDATTHQLAEQAELLRRERAEVVQRRTEMERHLADMREWYRKKLRELAEARNGEAGARSFDPEPSPPFDKPRLAELSDVEAAPGVPDPAPRAPGPALEELDPGDRQLGELLRSLELVDADTLTALWAEAGRQRRMLRQVLLASGAVTLYQLALIEAGNLDGLMLGRFRVIDRVRVTSREAMYRVLDPTRLDGKSAGVFLLRHLAEAEMEDAVHPDEFRQRFAAARDAAHPNLAGVVEVTEVNGRPAAILEWLTGLSGADWPAHAAHPGCWVRLVTMAAEGIEAAHRVGLSHGRLTSDSFILTASGIEKVTGFGEPPWLVSGPVSPVEPSPAADLRALGQAAFGWSQLGAKKRIGSRTTKPFPGELAAIIRRLEADPEPPMADTVAADRPYESAGELVADLKRIARDTPFSDDAWEKLLRHVADNAPDGPAVLRQSA